ncbi:hypothetical protein VaNZ11_004893 [Volvox africanus]|uniref:Gag-Pol polyprotein n=1 Tax=Volvox africanus TaxID=51714 RepID=A0ABQ5RXM7_9CHLO|nr:hypothetical protein VaNZ11_004893 [Volvox africanus]
MADMSLSREFVKELSSSNTRSWFHKMESVLAFDGYGDYILPTFVMPTEGAANYAKEKEMVRKARAAITFRLDPTTNASEISSSTGALDLWEKLKAWAKNMEGAVVIAASHAWAHLSKEGDESMTDFLTRAEDLFRKLDLDTNYKVTEAAAILHIVGKLPPTYSHFDSMFVAFGYPKSFADLRKVLVAEEAKRLIDVKSEVKESTPALFAERGRECFNCGEVGHVARFCPKKGCSSAGASTLTGESSSGGSRTVRQRSVVKCTWCGRPGHVEEKCWKKRDGVAKAVKEEKTEVGALTVVTRACEFVPLVTEQTREAIAKLESWDKCIRDLPWRREKFAALSAAVDKEVSVQDPWWLVSGSKNHITGDRQVLHNFRPLPSGLKINIEVGNGCILPAEGYGDVVLTRAPGVTIEHVIYVPGFRHNLVSVSSLTDKGFDVLFNQLEARITHGDVSIVAARCTTGLYKFMSSASQVTADFASPAEPPDAPAFLATEAKSVSLWHRRLGHLDLTNMKRLVQEGMVKGLEVTAKQLRGLEGRRCEPCILGKHARDPFPASESKTQKPMQLLHLDVCGPLPLSSCGHKFFVAMLDEYTGASLVLALKEKSDVADFVERAVAMLQVQSNCTLQCICTDGGGELVNRQVESYCVSKGVRHQLSVPYTPQQNGKAERLNRTLLDKVRAMLAESAVPKEYWHEALAVANFVRNRSPVAGKSKTPYELLTGVVPDVSLLRVFGCVAYAHVPKGKRDKLDPRAQKGTFLGYEPNSKAYRILLEDGRIQITRHVAFLEDEFTFGGHIRPV